MLNTVTYKGTKLLPLYPSGTAPTPRMTGKLAQGTYIAGQVVEESNTPGTYKVLTATDNTTKAALICEYDVVVDADGRHFMGSQAADETGVGDTYTSFYAPGGALSFATKDLSVDNAGGDLTAAVVAKLGGILVSGTAADGILQF